MDNGIYTDISHDAYHAMTDRISNSYLSRLAVCPAAARIPKSEGDEPAVLAFGRAFHLFVLEGLIEFGKGVAILPELNMRTNAGKEESGHFREINKGKAIITKDDYTAITEMDKAIKNHPFAAGLLAKGAREVSVFWDDPFSGLPCKARPDILPGRSVVVDLKKTRDASVTHFQRSILQFGYHRQAAFYLDGLEKATKEKYDVFAFIAVESTPPYRTEVYSLSPEFIEYGRNEYQFLINVETHCRADNHWPNYTANEVTEIGLPRWVK